MVTAFSRSQKSSICCEPHEDNLIIAQHKLQQFSKDTTFKILMPFTYVEQIPGKLFHNRVLTSFNYWLKLPHEKLTEIVSVVKMLQTTSLLIDDIQDNTLLRGNSPSAHCIYGVPMTINASLQVLYTVLDKILSLGHPTAPSIFSEHMLELIKGQGTEIYWRDHSICPTEEEYRDMVIGKTGAVFLLAVRLMQLFSEDKTDYTQITKLISVYFQIRDDYCNLINQEALEDCQDSNISQRYAEDLTEGKYSFPVIHALKNQEGASLYNILKQRTCDKNLKMHFVSELERLGSLKYTRDEMLRLDEETRLEINSLGGNPKIESVLNELLSWQKVSKRDYD